MNNQVTVVKNNKSGKIVTPSKNPEYGFVTVKQEKMVMQGSFRKKVTVYALINGLFADLTEEFTHDGQIVAGKIVIKESLTPTNAEDLDQDIKRAGDSNIPCTVGGAPIYRKCELTEDLGAFDIKVEHDNGEAIKAYQAQAKAQEASL